MADTCNLISYMSAVCRGAFVFVEQKLLFKGQSIGSCQFNNR